MSLASYRNIKEVDVAGDDDGGREGRGDGVREEPEGMYEALVVFVGP